MATRAAPEQEADTVYEWRAKRLRDLGVDDDLADLFALEDVDLHEIADLIAAGCHPHRALQIVF